MTGERGTGTTAVDRRPEQETDGSRSRLPAVLFVVLLLVSAAMFLWPTDDAPHPFSRADLVVHAATFAVLTAAGRWAFGRPTALLAGLVAYACGVELVQGLLLVGRTGDPLDILADLVGAVLAWLPWRSVLPGDDARDA